jgi:hypothetical protein
MITRLNYIKKTKIDQADKNILNLYYESLMNILDKLNSILTTYSKAVPSTAKYSKPVPSTAKYSKPVPSTAKPVFKRQRSRRNTSNLSGRKTRRRLRKFHE